MLSSTLLRIPTVAAAAIGLVALSACADSSSGSSDGDPSASDFTAGFIMVGSTNDAGYNQAVSEAAAAVEADLGITVLTADQIAENSNVTQTMAAMADQGADVIFATSYGYLPYAQEFAASHPDVVVLHQGGYVTDEITDNFGTYWGESSDPVSLGGIAAGEVTGTDKLGFIYAFPIPQTIANINAFQLGAQRVNADAQTYIESTSSWCDPVKQQQAVDSLVARGVDVLSNHQDCQATIIQAVQSADASLVGYHFDANELSPDAWLTGSAWHWAPLYESIIATVQDGSFTGSEFNDNWTGSFAQGNNPIELASFGASVPEAAQEEILAFENELKSGTSIFTGPIYCQDGSVLVAEGSVATYAEVNEFDCLVEGVVGELATGS